MGATIIKTRIRAKGGVITRGNQNYGWRNNLKNMPPPRVSESPPEKKMNLEQALTQMLTSHTAFMNETKANMQNQAT